MILPPDRPQALKEIEEQLSEADPGFAAMFTRFGTDPGRAVAEVRRERTRYVIMMACLWTLLALCLTMIAVTALR